MKIYSLRAFNFGWAVLLSVLILTGCGGDNNPISPGNAQITQISSVNSQVPQNVFSSTLTGAQEVPSVTSIGSGTGVVSVDPATNQMRATIVTGDINGTQAHIHIGATGVAGPVVFSLAENEAGSNVWTTTATLTADQLSQLTTGNYYFNVHTVAYPDGEIRGQILAQLPPSGSAINTANSNIVTSAGFTDNSTTASGNSSTGTTISSSSSNDITANANANANRAVFFVNLMSGSLVVPPNASTATATGLTAYHPKNRILAAVVVSRELAGTGANIRQAVAGATGPLVSSFTETSPGSGIWVLRTALTTTQATALSNGGMYYELLSSAFPAGELRGQVVRTEGTTAPATPVTPVTTTTPAISGTTPSSSVTPTAPTVMAPIQTTASTTTATTPTTTTITPITSTTAPTTATPTMTATTPTITTTPTSTTPTTTPAATDTTGASPYLGTTTTSRTVSTSLSTTTPRETVTPVAMSPSTSNTETSPLNIAAQ